MMDAFLEPLPGAVARRRRMFPMNEHVAKRLGLALAAGIALAATGCDPFTRLDFTQQTALPPGDRVDFSNMRITEGRAVGFIATPMQGREQMGSDTEVLLESRNP